MADKTEFAAPETWDQAVSILDTWKTKALVVAGGTDVVADLNLGKAQPPACLVSLSRLQEADYVRLSGGQIAIGALATHALVAASDLVRQRAPVLADAAAQVGGPSIRNMGTIAGNLVRASPAADTALALLALDAAVETRSAAGTRTIPIADFFVGPGRTVLRPGELVTQVTVPDHTGARGAFTKLGKRNALFIAVVNVAVSLWLFDGKPRPGGVRIALGAVAPTPIRARGAEAFLEAKAVTPEVLHQAAALAQAEARPIDDGRASAWYRREMVGVLVERALRAAILPAE